MGIRVACPNGHQLNVKDFLAGKRGICPHCKARFDIPAHSAKPQPAAAPTPQTVEAPVEAAAIVAPSEPSVPIGPPEPEPVATTPAATPLPAQPAPAAPESASEQVAWYVRPPAGGQYGPADDAMMRQWISEGRVPSNALVWRTGWSEWQQSETVAERLPGAAQVEPTAGGIELPTAEAGVAVLDEPAASRGPSPAESAASRLQRKRRAAARTQAWMAGLLLVVAVILFGVLVWVLRDRDEAPNENPPASTPTTDTEPDTT